MEAAKKQNVAKLYERTAEANKRVQELNDSFSKEAERKLQEKMDAFQEKKDAHMKALQDRLKDHVRKTLDVHVSHVCCLFCCLLIAY